MIEVLQEAFDKRNKKQNKIEKIKAIKKPLEALQNLKNLNITDEDKSFFLKCFGCFYKEATNDYMIRVRISEGKLTPKQAEEIGNIAKEYGDDYIDLTTRAQIELRYIKEENLYQVLTKLENIGITTYQTGVDNFRGIVIDPLSNISKSSIINERVYAQSIQDLFLKVEDEIASLPRKFNIGFCGNYKNTSNVFGQDLAFVLAKKDGVYGFKVFLGGRVGVIAKDSNIFVSEDEILLFFKGVKELFTKYGFRDNRNKNRFHFLLQDVGIKNFILALEEYVDYKFQRGAEVLTSVKTDTSLIEELKDNTKAYKFIVPSGIFSGTSLIEASLLAKRYNGFIALTIDQNFYITSCDETITQTNLYKKYIPSTYTNNLIACAGTKTCSFAVIRNKEDAIDLANELETLIPLDGTIKFHWSGCIKGCGIHGLGDFGFVGAKLKVDGVMSEAVDIYIGGNSQKEGKKILKAPLKDLTSYIKPMIQFYANNKQEGESFEDFLNRANYSYWAYAFIMKLNSIGFDFIPSFHTNANKIEIFEIKDIANQIFYKLTKTHSLDNIFTPLQVKLLKDYNLNKPIDKIIDNMVQGKYKTWTEIIVELG